MGQRARTAATSLRLKNVEGSRSWDYDPAWPGAFEEARAAIERLLGGLVLEIHHIGSTAVPGLCAKPKIDVDIVLRSAAEIRRPSSA